MSYDYPEIGEAIVIHDMLIQEFGGAPGIRDEGALAAALMRPQLGYYDSLDRRGGRAAGEPGEQPPLCRRQPSGPPSPSPTPSCI